MIKILKREVAWFIRREMNCGPFCKILSNVLLAQMMTACN